jgi:tetratricopeptide (TPR) repeat protein
MPRRPVKRGPKPLRLSLVGVVVATGVLVAACGRASGPTAAGPTPTGPTSTTVAPATDAVELPMLDKALHEQSRGQYAQAVADFLAVVKADPTNAIAWYDLGVIADLHGEATEAVTDYEASITGDKSYLPALYNLAVLEATVQPKDAAVLYGDVLRLQPGNADAHLNLGFVLRSLGQTAAGRRQFAAAVKLAPALSSRVPAADLRPA